MAAVPVATWISLRDATLEAIRVITETGKSVSYQGRSMSMEDMSELRTNLDYYEGKIRQASGTATRSRVSYVVPVV